MIIAIAIAILTSKQSHLWFARQSAKVLSAACLLEGVQPVSKTERRHVWEYQPFFPTTSSPFTVGKELPRPLDTN